MADPDAASVDTVVGPSACRRTVWQRVLALVLTVRRWLTALRVRAHLRRTERALRRADTRHLDPRQRRRREAALDALRGYRERGAVSTNEGANERAPQFVGANGVPCAVAALALADGEADLVEQVAARENDLRVEDLPGDPARASTGVSWSTGSIRRDSRGQRPRASSPPTRRRCCSRPTAGR